MKKKILGLAAFISCAGTLLAAEPAGHLTVDELQQVKLPDVILESAKQVDGAAGHVEVRGRIGGTVLFELLLPDKWNGRFAMGGGGGFVGTIQNSARDSIRQGYATAGTDTGHEAQPGYTAGWALNDLEAQLNFGYLAVHRTAEVSKALIRAYYRRDAEYCYFLGCSRGGGQAMMEAQRYPKDFDGVVAGAPAFNWTGIAAFMVSIAKALYPDPAQLEKTALTKDALQKLAAGIIEQCDAQDGLKDGIVANPAAARFELAKVQGLTDEQRKAIEAIFQGAKNSRGLIYPGFTPGAECIPDQWIGWLVGPVPGMKDHMPNLTFAFGTEVFKNFVFHDPDWDYSKYDFSGFEKETKLTASILNATDPVLEGLKARKGKLIIWHGWADTALPAQAAVDYYRQVQGHDPRAADYCRLFMVPGCLHCGGGPGATEVNWLAVISDWVEREKSPDRLIATKTEKGKTVFTRPLYPYPQWAAYKGSGDADQAENFEAK